MTPTPAAPPPPLRDAGHPDEQTATAAWLATGHGVRFRDAMTTIVHACDQALADARLTTTRDLDGPLHSLVADLRRGRDAWPEPGHGRRLYAQDRGRVGD